MHQADPWRVCELSHAHGFGWVAVQRNPFNLERLQTWHDACAATGVVFGIWEDRANLDPERSIPRMGARFYIAEAESYLTEWEPVIEGAARAGLYGPSCAVATNFGSFTKGDGKPAYEKAAPLVEAGWACLTECYLPEQPQLAPNPCEKLDFRARQLGFQRVQPIIGVYWGVTASDYTELDIYPGFSVWTAESMGEDDWRWLGERAVIA